MPGEAALQYRILGPLEVVRHGKLVELGGAKERTLLALLLLEPNRVRPVDRLIDELWGEAAPESANVSLRVLVSHVRKALAAAGANDAVVTSSPGYVLKVSPAQVDALRFDDLAARGRSEMAQGDATSAATTFRDALALWRGPALAGLADTPAIAASAVRLEESRVEVLEERITADLASGRHALLCSELEELVVIHPLRERLWAARMLALYRTGRQADALAAYQTLRTTLSEELGIDPSPEVAELQRAILSQDPKLDLVSHAPRDSAKPSEVPTGVVTFLLTDIEGSSAAWERDPEGMARALERHDELIEAFVGAGGGVVVKQKGEGDATLAVFRRATEALSTAVDLQQAFSSEDWPPSCSLRVRMALHTGESHERSGDYYGPTVNRAARLRAIARGGQIVLSQATAELVRDHLPTGLALIDLGTHELKGLARGEHVFEVRVGESEEVPEETKPVEIPYPAALRPTGSGIFVGRDAELARLTKMFEAAAGGHRQALLVAGEPGIGKTRLAAEAGTRWRDTGAIVLYGRCDEDLGVPYQPFVEALGPYVSACPIGQLASATMAQDLALIFPGISQRIPNLPPLLHTDPDSERYRLFEAMVSLLTVAGKSAPTVIVLDDLQWAAKPTLLLLRHLLRSDSAMRVLVLGIYRDTDLSRTHPLAEMLADMRREGNLGRIALGGLGEDEIVAFLEAASGHELDERGVALAEELHRETEGNPFFMTEVMRHLVETGAIRQENGRWTSSAADPIELGLPEGVREVISRRLSRLSQDANRALTVAAVVGPSFSWRVLEAIPEAAGEGPLLEAIEEAERARLVTEETAGQFAFTHALIRQSLLEEVSAARRIRLHGQIAQALEALHRGGPPMEALAYHYAEAAMDGYATKAADYALLASRVASSHLAFEEAAGYLERGISALEMAGEIDRERRTDMLMSLAEASRASGDIVASRGRMLEATEELRLFSSPDRLSRAVIYLVRDAPAGQSDPILGALCEEAVSTTGDEFPGARARALASMVRYRTWVEEGEPHSEMIDAAIDEAARSGSDATLAEVLAVVTWTVMGTVRAEQQLIRADQAIAAGERMADVQLTSDGIVARAMALLQLGDREGFEEELKRLFALGESSRSWWTESMALSLQACAHMLDGRFSEIDEITGRMAQIGGRDPNVALIVLADRLIMRLQTGHLDEAGDYLESAFRTRPDIRILRVLDAVIQLARGRVSEAADAARSLIANDFAETRRGPLWVIALGWLTEIAAAAHDTESAQAILAKLEPFSGQAIVLTRVISLGSVDARRGVLLTTLGAYDEAEECFEAGLALVERMRSAAWIAWTKTEFGRLLLKRRAPRDENRANTLLVEALTTATELGMEPLISDIRALLRPQFPRAITRRESAMFVGRAAEMEILLGLWERTASGAPQTALIAGEPGIGKTWLASEIARVAYDAGALVLYGRCEEDLGVPYQPFVEALRTYVESVPALVVRRDAGQGIADLALLLQDLAFPQAPEPVRSDPESERLRLFEAVADLLAALTKHTPVVLFLDDLQWAAKPTLLMLRHLLRLQDPLRLLVLGVYRDTDLARTHPLAEILADLRKEGPVTRVSLTGLAKEDIASFIAAASGHPLDARGRELVDALYAETEGNPFFMTEVMRHLVETGLVYTEQGVWRARVATAGELGLPEGVREVISRRLSRLSESVNRVLAVAAVVGPTFSSRVLEAVPEAADDPATIIDSLEEAERARLLVEEGPGAFRFTHALIRQTLMEEISSTRRIRLHGHIAQAIEQQPDAQDQVEALAHHYAEAAIDGHAQAAVRYSEIAAERSRARLAFEEGASYLDLALTALELQRPADLFKRAELLLRLAEIRQSLGDLAGTRQVAIEAAELARTTGSAEQLARCAFLLTRQGAIGLPDPEARQFGEEALASLPEEARTLRATVMAGLARYQAWDESKGAGVDLGRQALQLARDSGDRRTLSDVLSVVLFTLYGTARMDEIIDLSDEMIALAETISDPSSRSDALAARALARLALGEQEGFKSDRLELERFAAQYRLRLKSAIAASLKVIEALAAGRFDEAESDSRTMLDSGEDDPNIVNLSLGHNVVLARERGLYDRLLPRLAALPETRPGMVGLATGVSSLFYAELRDHVAARDCLDRMLLDDMALVPTDAARSVILCCAAESAARLGATDYAAPIRNALAPWAGQITFTGRSVAWGAADRFLAMLAALGRDFDAAESLYRSAIALEDRLDAPPFLARTRWWYAEMLMSRDGEGDRKLASDLLDQAISTASSLNMPVLLVEAEELRSKA